MSTTGAARAPQLEPVRDVQLAASTTDTTDKVQAVLDEALPFKRTARPGQPVPTRGRGRVSHALWSANLGGFDYDVPPMTGREAVEYRRKQAYVEVLRRELVQLAVDVKAILSVMNSKGGASKTPTACYLATVLDWAIESMIILADVNESRGTTCSLMNLKRKSTKTIRWAIDNIDQFADFEDVTRLLNRPPQRGTGVRVLASDVASSTTFTQQQCVDLLSTLKRKCDSMVCDCGNQISHVANLSALKVATHLVLPALAGDKESIEGVISTMATYIGMGNSDKLRRSFIVVNRVAPSDNPVADKESVLKELAKAASELDEADLGDGARDSIKIPHGGLDLEFFGITPERVFLIPNDPYIGEQQPAHAESLQIDTLIAYLELLVGIFRQEISTTGQPHKVPPVSA